MYLFFLAMEACDNANVLKVVYYIKQFLDIVFILIPVVLIVIVSIDFFKAVTSDEEGMKKNTSLIIRRLIYAAVIFLIPSLVKFSITNFVESDVGYGKCLTVTKSKIKAQIIANKNDCISNGNEWDSESNECLFEKYAPNKGISVFGGSVLVHNSGIDGESQDETTTTHLDGNNNKEKVWIFLRKKGLSKAGAAGAMGNLQAEHRFQTSDTSGGLGIVQWIGNRRRNCIKLANKQGKSYTDLSVQLDFMWSELVRYKSLLNTLKTTNDVFEATKLWCNKFERPSLQIIDKTTSICTSKVCKVGKRKIYKNQKDYSENRRYTYAKDFYKKYKNAD